MENVKATILDQLGGREFEILTGATFLRADSNELAFQLPRNGGNIRTVRIRLRWDDTYNVRFFNVRGREVKKSEGIYCDMLRDLFEETTQLYTRFHPRK